MAVTKIDPTKRFKVISQFDDAIENESIEELEKLRLTTALSRYDQYLETLDESMLKLKPDAKPDRFVIRCPLNKEMAVLNNKYLQVDTVSKSVSYTNRVSMFYELFDMCVAGVENEDGSLTPVTSESVPQHVASQLGSTILILASMSKNEKK